MQTPVKFAVSLFACNVQVSWKGLYLSYSGLAVVKGQGFQCCCAVMFMNYSLIGFHAGCLGVAVVTGY